MAMPDHNKNFFLPCAIMRSWREQKILLKRIFPILSDADFEFEEGNKDSMLKKLEEKLGKSKRELELIFAEIQLM